MSIGHMIISIIAIVALVCLALFAIYKERSRAGWSLGAALAVTAALELFDMCSLQRSFDVFAWKRYALFCEGLLPPLWILCSITYARQHSNWKTGWLLKAVVVLTLLFSIVAVTLPLDSFYYAPDFPKERLLFLSTAGFFFYIGIMFCLVIALVNFETTLTSASPDSLRKIKFNIIGLGIILAVLIFYFSQAVLYRTLSMDYEVLRSFLYIVAAAMIGYAQIFQSGAVRIHVSRQTAYKSMVLLAVGIYLVMTGLLGEGMQHLGIHFPRAVTVSVAFLAGIALLILLLSERVRREVKVVLQKNFYQNKHDYRTQWLSFTEQLSTSRSSDELLQRILSAYCDIFGITGAALFLNEESHGGYCMTALYKMEPIQEVIAPDNSLVRFMQERAWVVNVKDDNPAMLAENAHFFSDNHISIIIPLFDGERLAGFIALGKAIKVMKSISTKIMT